MSDTDTLVNRVRQVLTDLAFLSEAKAAKPVGDKLSSTHAQSQAPVGDRSEFDFHFGEIEAAVAKAEKRARSDRVRVKQEPETREQFRWRILNEHKGKTAQKIADIERVSVAFVNKLRQGK